METLIFYAVVIAVIGYALHAAYLKVGWFGLLVAGLVLAGLIDWYRQVKRKREQEERDRQAQAEEKRRIDNLRSDLKRQKQRVEEDVQKLRELASKACADLDHANAYFVGGAAVLFWESIDETSSALNQFLKVTTNLQYYSRGFDETAAKLGERFSSRDLVVVSPDAVRYGRELEHLRNAGKTKFEKTYLELRTIKALEGIADAIEGLGDRLEGAIRSLDDAIRQSRRDRD